MITLPEEKDSLKEHQEMDNTSIDPKRSALLVMDMQNGILGQFPGADELIDRIEHAVSFAREVHMRVGFVRIAFNDADYASIPAHNERFRQVAEARLMHHEAPETAFHPRLSPQPGDFVVRKTRVGAFSTTDLGEQLQEQKVTTLILSGIATSGVVLSTVRDAADRDYRVYVLSDATADPDEEVHAMLLGKVFPRQAVVVETGRLAELLATYHAR